MRNRLLPSILSACLAIPLSGAWAQGQGRGTDWMWHSSSGWGHMIFGALILILFWGGIIVLIVLLVRWLSGHAGPQHPATQVHKTPIDILKERFAHGEIDKDEYEERRKLLSD